MDIVIPKPEFALKVTKSDFVIIPFPVKVHWTILPSLEYHPLSTLSALITIDKKYLQTQSFKTIDAIFFKAILEKL